MWCAYLLLFLVLAGVGGGRHHHHHHSEQDGKRYSVSSNSLWDETNKSEETEKEDESVKLVCPSCEHMHCFPKRASKLKCAGGITLGVCGCCPVCAKLENEPCGGQHNYLGRCDRGLTCQVTELQTWKGKDGHGMKKSYRITRGICKKVTDLPLSDQGYATYCQPPCTPEFCAKNPNAICSASDTVDKPKQCQEPCQHTACAACRLVPPEPSCGKCRDGDYGCYRRFARCVKKHTCSRPRFPCTKDTAYELREDTGKFVCLVPDCIEN